MTGDVFIGLGSNLGDRLANLGAALAAIAAFDDTHVDAVSAVVESEPWGVTDQPPFANAVARITTGMQADRLLESLKDVEVAMGRVPGERNGPRIIDLDILLFGDEEWASEDLVVPHPRLAERDFVVTPLLEIAPDAVWPAGGPITHDRALEGRVTGRLGLVPGFEDLTPAPGHAPIPGDDTAGWETVASVYAAVRLGTAFGPELLFDAAVLEAAGIEIGWDPFAPGDESLPWPLPRTFRLLVPSAQADRARAILADAHANGALLEPDALDGYRAETDGDDA